MSAPDFHDCALRAYVEIARRVGGWPDSEAVKKLAYEYYERELKEWKSGSEKK